MYRDRDFDLEAPPPSNAEDLTRDLGLDTVIEAMAGEDRFLAAVATAALLASLTDPEAVRYRQRILDDCLRHPALPRDLYDLAGEALDWRRKIWAPFASDSPSTSLSHSVSVLEHFTGMLRRLRAFAAEHRAEVRSDGLTALFDLLLGELDDPYFAEIDEHLAELRFRRGELLSARLGQGSRGTGYVVRRAPDERSWFARLLSLPEGDALTFTIPERDDAGWQALGALRDEGLAQVARALAEATEHLQAFFTMLRREIGFYVGCVNLHQRLRDKGEPLCMPEPLEPGTATLACRGVYEPVLSLRQEERVVGNDATAEHVPLIVVTGANQGGKSTFLRSIGVAQLMMQAGMSVPAEAFTATCYRRVFTHYRREEDAAMVSGKLDEELRRMSAIADDIGPGCLLLSNESFASTNEREGSQIARHVFGGLVACGVTVVAVTHLFDLAHSLYQQGRPALFLRADRRDDGRRTFRLAEGAPLATSFGVDLYERIFGDGPPEALVGSGAEA